MTQTTNCAHLVLPNLILNRATWTRLKQKLHQHCKMSAAPCSRSRKMQGSVLPLLHVRLGSAYGVWRLVPVETPNRLKSESLSAIRYCQTLTRFCLYGYVDSAGIIFVWFGVQLFMVNLKSGQITKLKGSCSSLHELLHSRYRFWFTSAQNVTFFYLVHEYEWLWYAQA